MPRRKWRGDGVGSDRRGQRLQVPVGFKRLVVDTGEQLPEVITAINQLQDEAQAQHREQGAREIAAA